VPDWKSYQQAPPERQMRGSEATETEVIVIGSGIGGLSCAALLAKYGIKV
jgi:ribulose 1,5-bisphosphate synthetase/thiazole synthase